MDGLGEPRDQPIGMLPMIAHLIDEGLADTNEQCATLLEARHKPWVLGDALINRSKRVNGEALEWCGLYDRQLTRWLDRRLCWPSLRMTTVASSCARMVHSAVTSVIAARAAFSSPRPRRCGWRRA